LREAKFKTEIGKSCDRLLQKIISSVRALKKTAEERRLEVLGIGIGCAGLVDPKKVSVLKAPNILCLEGCQIGKILERALNLKVVIGNDVQVGLWG